MSRRTKAPAPLHPIHVAELIWLYEDMALSSEFSGRANGPMVAECIRKQAAGMITAIAIVEQQSPGYADLCIRKMAEACGVELP